MIKYAREQFFLSANELVNSLQRKISKSYWVRISFLISELNQGLSFNLILTNLEGILLTTISRYLCVNLLDMSSISVLLCRNYSHWNSNTCFNKYKNTLFTEEVLYEKSLAIYKSRL
jgi:hypothetical protein